jgi:hypothetical protein
MAGTASGDRFLIAGSAPAGAGRHETMNRMTGPTDTDPPLVRALETIARHGHLVQWEVGKEDGPTLFYTVGLTVSSDHGFELALSGMLPPTTGQDILNNTARQLADKEPAEGMFLDGVILNNYPVRLRTVAPERRFGWIAEIYGEQRAPVWQVLWPDQVGFFPGDPEYMHPSQMQVLL